MMTLRKRVVEWAEGRDWFTYRDVAAEFNLSGPSAKGCIRDIRNYSWVNVNVRRVGRDCFYKMEVIFEYKTNNEIITKAMQIS